MPIRDILLLGDPRLYERSEEANRNAGDELLKVVDDLRDTLMDFRSCHGYGRAIAAPQIGEMKRLIYLHINEPMIIFNPTLSELSDPTVELWDNCLSFPGLLVKVRRHQTCALHYFDRDWHEVTRRLDGDLSELIQHECDHLDGILAPMRAIDSRSFAISRQPSQPD